jgi:hypothetical protein
VSGIEIETHGANVAAAHLTEMGVRAADVRPAKPALDAIFAGDERARFDLDGPGWAALSDVTDQLKAQAGLDPRIMRATGVLYNSLAHATGSIDREGYPDSLAFGTDVPYARFHQHGTRYMAQRKIVDLSVVARREMEEALSAYIARGLP